MQGDHYPVGILNLDMSRVNKIFMSGSRGKILREHHQTHGEL